jgi:hypothetical protein
LVKYTYVFTNAGDQLLELSVASACGCITADWSRKVEPGKTGVIPIAFNTANYSGPVLKSITVTCNDRTNPRPVLQFKGTVWRPVDVFPAMVVLNLTPDAPLPSTTVHLTNNLAEPITLSAPESNNRAFAAELKTIQPGKEFQVVIAPVSPLAPGRVQAQITLKTSSTNVPVLTIPVLANVPIPQASVPKDGPEQAALAAFAQRYGLDRGMPPSDPSASFAIGTNDATGPAAPGPEGLSITKVTPLFLRLSLDSVAVSDRGPAYVIGVQNEAAPNPAGRAKRQKYCRVGSTNETFRVREVKVSPDNPAKATVALELSDTGEHVELTEDRPFQRLAGYMADLKYGPEHRAWTAKRVGSVLAFGGDEYQIIAITQTVVALRQRSNGKTWATEYTGAPESQSGDAPKQR